jgi:hypothetical protein
MLFPLLSGRTTDDRPTVRYLKGALFRGPCDLELFQEALCSCVVCCTSSGHRWGESLGPVV